MRVLRSPDSDLAQPSSRPTVSVNSQLLRGATHWCFFLIEALSKSLGRLSRAGIGSLATSLVWCQTRLSKSCILVPAGALGVVVGKTRAHKLDAHLIVAGCGSLFFRSEVRIMGSFLRLGMDSRTIPGSLILYLDANGAQARTWRRRRRHTVGRGRANARQ